MTPVKFEGINRIYRGTATLSCEDLPALADVDTVTSHWQPTPEELDKLAHGGVVELVVKGGQPAVALGVV